MLWIWSICYNLNLFTTSNIKLCCWRLEQIAYNTVHIASMYLHTILCASYWSISSWFYRNSEESALEYQENPERMFPRHNWRVTTDYMDITKRSKVYMELRLMVVTLILIRNVCNLSVTNYKHYKSISNRYWFVKTCLLGWHHLFHDSKTTCVILR